MKKRILFWIIFLMMLPISMQAQGESSWWYFGNNAGLNFNAPQKVTSSNGLITSGIPKAVNGPLKSLGGSFTLSDIQGNLLMSSDGITIYNRKNEIMTNGTGLLGSTFSMQSGIVIPAPNNPKKFYVVTVSSQVDYSHGIRYSVVNIDPSNPNDMGSVEVATKNSLLKMPHCGENLGVVAHKNGTDYWLVNRTGVFFYVWHLTEQGFSKTPKMYKTPPLPDVDKGAQIGATIVSVDNTKLVNLAAGSYTILSADFNPATGVISDIRGLGNTKIYSLGGAFSPKGEYFYLGAGNESVESGYKIKYSDLRAGNVMPTPLDAKVFNFSLGRDGRVYGITRTISSQAADGNRDLHVVMDPDKGGTDIRTFPGYLTNRPQRGFPSFKHSNIITENKTKLFTCEGYEAKFDINLITNGIIVPTGLFWDFGDGTYEMQNFIAGKYDYEMNHLFANSGLYKVSVMPYIGTKGLSKTFLEANIIDCSLKTNPMIRHELLNINELETNK
jgi:hypothetical protein